MENWIATPLSEARNDEIAQTCDMCEFKQSPHLSSLISYF